MSKIILGVITILLVVAFLWFIGKNTTSGPPKPLKYTKVAMALVKDSILKYVEDCGRPPKSLESLTVSCKSGVVASLKVVPKDGWGRELLYVPEKSEVMSLGRDGEEGGIDDNKDLSLSVK